MHCVKKILNFCDILWQIMKFNYERFYKNKKVYYTLFLSFFVYNKIHFFCIIRYNIIIPRILFKTEHFISMSLFLLRDLFFCKYDDYMNILNVY